MISILKKICRGFNVPFSFDVVEGGYIHDDGEYTEEKSIVNTFIDVPQETVDEIAKEACVLSTRNRFSSPSIAYKYAASARCPR